MIAEWSEHYERLRTRLARGTTARRLASLLLLPWRAGLETARRAAPALAAVAAWTARVALALAITLALALLWLGQHAVPIARATAIGAWRVLGWSWRHAVPLAAAAGAGAARVLVWCWRWAAMLAVAAPMNSWRVLGWSWRHAVPLAAAAGAGAVRVLVWCWRRAAMLAAVAATGGWRGLRWSSRQTAALSAASAAGVFRGLGWSRRRALPAAGRAASATTRHAAALVPLAGTAAAGTRRGLMTTYGVAAVAATGSWRGVRAMATGTARGARWVVRRAVPLTVTAATGTRTGALAVAHWTRVGVTRSAAAIFAAAVFAVVCLGIAVVWVERTSRGLERQARRARRRLLPLLAVVSPATGRAVLHLITQAAPSLGGARRRLGGGRGRNVGPGLQRLGEGIGHQFQAAAALGQPHFRPLEDGHGRRMRASAYRHHRGAVRRGGDMAGTVFVRRFRRVALFTLTAVLFTFGSFFGGSQAFINVSANLPDVHQLRATPLPEDSLVYAADGTLLADLHDPGVQRYFEPLSKMQKSWLPQSVVAIEDANFWHGMAVDPQGIARAALVDLQRGQTQQGASTITQQLVRLQLLKDYSQTLDRKVKEAILAVQAQQVYTKSQILEMYLNGVHFGNQAMGAQAASQNYFRKDVDKLDLAEASMLAGIPQSPFYNDPTRNWDIAKNRQHEVLDAMVRTNMIKPAAAREAFAEDLRPELHYPADAVKGAPAFTDWVTQELITKYGTHATLEGGLRVATTINMGLQGIAEQSVRNQVNAVMSKNVHQGAMTAIDPRTGEVMAMVGSLPDGPAGQFNYAADVPRSPGSSFKIFTYTAAIASGKFTMTTPIQDSPVTISMLGQAPGYQPKNYDLKYHGTCELQKCMGNSLNVPAVKVEITVGVDQVVEMARRMGAPPWLTKQMPDGSAVLTQDQPASAYGASTTLGSAPETPVQMATAAATIADNGVLHPPTGIASITASDGMPLFKYDPATTAQQVLDPRVAFIMQTIMSNDDNRAMIFGKGSALTLPGRLVGAKTGTAEDFKDAWTVGYTPALASAFWFGNPDDSAMQTGFDAVFAAAPGWHAFMDSALAALQRPNGEWYGPPPGLVGGGPNLWALPGTKLGSPPPPLPSWASSGAAPKSQAKPGG